MAELTTIRHYPIWLPELELLTMETLGPDLQSQELGMEQELRD